MRKLASELIEANKRSQSPFLDLGNCGLTAVPDQVRELPWLEKVSLASYWYEFNHGKGEWEGYESSNNGPQNSGLVNVEALADLRSLNSLILRNTAISSVEPLEGLTALEILDVGGTKLESVSPLSQLAGLRELYIWESKVRDIEPLSALKQLRIFSAGETPLAQLSPLEDLTELSFLYICGCKVQDLSPIVPMIRRGCPVLWTRTSGGPGIYVEGCPLKTPPPEIARQGGAAVLSYFDERRHQQVDHLYEAKMLIIGKGGAGKTSLLRRLYQPEQPLPSAAETTKGIAIYRHDFPLPDGHRFRLNVWDFGGQEIYHATHHFFLTRRSLYVLVDDTGSDGKSVSDNDFKYWLELVETFGAGSPVLIFQNEKGGRPKAIDFVGIKRRFENVERLHSGDLQHRDAVGQLKEAIEFFASHLTHVGDELPASWVRVRAAIERRGRVDPYISQQEYFALYGRYLPLDRTKALHLSQYFHDLGVCLHFQNDLLLQEIVILQNNWATEAVFRILDDATVKNQFGQFTREDCTRAWSDYRYAHMHPQLLALMQLFELCYELRDSLPRMWLAPQLLPPARPENLGKLGRPGELSVRYRYEFLPKGMISRLTVRLHRFVESPDKAWATGVVFEKDGSAVVAELLPNGSEIELRGYGLERKDLMSVVQADLDALNDSFEGLRGKIQRRIPCNCSACSNSDKLNPEFYEYEMLIRRKRDRRLKLECRQSYEEVDVLTLLEGADSSDRPAWAGRVDGPTERTIRVFLASSSELRDDRDAFDLHFRQRSNEFRKRGCYLEIVRWENFLDAVSGTRLQDEYNESIRTCDLFVILVFTKVGRFTHEEFETAYNQFQKSGRPLIFTYFKDTPISIATPRGDLQSRWAFEEKLERIGHFLSRYSTTEDLLLQFSGQLARIL